MARVTMLAMHKDGLIVLPPPKWPCPPLLLSALIGRRSAW